MATLLKSHDFLAGVIFAFIGIAAMAIAQNYQMGTLSRMGPGFFPFLLGIVITALGVMLMLRPVLFAESRESIGRLDPRPMLFIIASVASFGTVVENAGLIVGISVMTVLAWAGSRSSSLRELVPLIVVLNITAIGIFVFGLNMSLRLGFW